jgi:TorA maturation chaperone TorD
MNSASAAGISAGFWEEFLPEISNEHIRAGINKLAAYGEAARLLDEDAAIRKCAVEYTKLFIGPPTPAAPPWETMYKGEEAKFGFGQPTFEMKQLLRDAGLELKNDNNQYEDHLGIELLYLAALCGRMHAALSEGVEDDPATASSDDAANRTALGAFIKEHPLQWIGALRDKINAAYPNGYFSGLAELVQGILEWHSESLETQTA